MVPTIQVAGGGFCPLLRSWHSLSGWADCSLVIKKLFTVERLAQDQFDVLVIGGGITGAGVAPDAAARGYRVALVEKVEFAYKSLKASCCAFWNSLAISPAEW